MAKMAKMHNTNANAISNTNAKSNTRACSHKAIAL